MSVTGGILGWAFSWLAGSVRCLGHVRAVSVPHGCHPAGFLILVHYPYAFFVSPCIFCTFSFFSQPTSFAYVESWGHKPKAEALRTIPRLTPSFINLSFSYDSPP